MSFTISACKFMFEANSSKMVDTDGRTLYPKFTRDDIWTDGEGFDFMIEEDPSFGDNVVQRNQPYDPLEIAIKYETYRMNSNDPELLKSRFQRLCAGWWKRSGGRLMPNSWGRWTEF